MTIDIYIYLYSVFNKKLTTVLFWLIITTSLILHKFFPSHIFSSETSEWVIVALRQLSNFSAISWREQVNFHWDDDEVRFVLNQLAELDFNSASSLKQQSAGRHVSQLGHIILIPCQPVFALSSLMLRV